MERISSDEGKGGEIKGGSSRGKKEFKSGKGEEAFSHSRPSQALQVIKK